MKLKDKILVKVSKEITPKINKIIAQLGYQYHQIIFVTDKNIWENNKIFFSENFIKKFGKFLILDNPKADEKHAQIIEKQAIEYKLILAFGSGTINDLCKYVAKKSAKNYLVLISALSMNGYCSKNASISINNHKKTIEGTLPIAILCDLSILKNSPTALTKAGLADVLCFYSCIFDLMLSKFVFLQKINPRALKLQQKTIENFTNNYQKYSLQDEGFLKILLKMILNSGWAMTIANSSAPASQSEHLLAHLLSMKFPTRTQNILHGRMIASTTICSLEAQVKILEKISKNQLIDILQENFSSIKNNQNYNQLIDYLGVEIATECLEEYALKRDYFIKNSAKILKNYSQNYKKIAENLTKILLKKEVLIKIFNHYLVDYDFKNIGFTNLDIQRAQGFVKYIRNRITSSDIEEAFLKSE